MTERPPPEQQPQQIGADAARGGEIILRTRRERQIFAGGLAAPILLAILAGIFGLIFAV